ncbi:MAG: hypothetical protein MZW92_60475 [Comamonadaceae bacterium]|nr:hypothetical protein [Comamonadaceae bacterium]
MTSCAEATFFLRNCPTVEMDGDGDGACRVRGSGASLKEALRYAPADRL